MDRRRTLALAALLAVLAAGLPSFAEREPTLTLPAADLRSAPRRLRVDQRAILDCSWHGAWHEPEGWRVAKVGDEVLAWNADQTAVLMHAAAPQKDLGPARKLAERVAGTAIAFGKAKVARKNRWHSTTTLRGEGKLAGASVEVLVAQHWRGFRKDLVWVQVALGERRGDSMRVMDIARASLLMLVSHACECGYDCDRRVR
jgi:hypothetical protein